jgi:hypothetical protein
MRKELERNFQTLFIPLCEMFAMTVSKAIQQKFNFIIFKSLFFVYKV